MRTSAALGGDEGTLSTTVGSRKLIDILKSLPGDQIVSLTSSGTKLTLQAGKSRFTMQTLPADDFPLVNEAVDFGPSFGVPQKVLKSLIDQVHFAMAVHDIRYYLNGILFVAEGKTLTLVATDGHRLGLAQATLETEIPKQEVILPRKTVLELPRLLQGDEEPDRDALRRQPGQVRVLGPGVRHQAGRGQVPRLQPRDPEEPQERGHRSGRQPLLSSLQRAAILTSEKFKGVRVNLEPGALRIASSNAEQEEAKEELEIDYGGDAIEIGFNVTYLMDALNNIDHDMVKLELQDGNSSALITVPEQPGFKYVVMPMRI